jgi:hypothetical protein
MCYFAGFGNAIFSLDFEKKNNKKKQTHTHTHIHTHTHNKLSKTKTQTKKNKRKERKKVPTIQIVGHICRGERQVMRVCCVGLYKKAMFVCAATGPTVETTTSLMTALTPRWPVDTTITMDRSVMFINLL